MASASNLGMGALMRMSARIASKASTKVPLKADEAGLHKVILRSTVLKDCDEAIVLLLNERARAQESLWELEGPGDGVPSAEMTATQLEHIDETNHAVGSAISFNSLKNIFQEVSRACSKLRHSVAYLGPPATYTHQAARTRFGINAAYIQVERIPDVFHAVEKGKAEFGVAPVENSTEGAISQTLDLLATTELQVVAEVTLDIRHYLLSHAELNRVQKVYSHPQALAQCRAWLTSNVPGAEIIAESSTARSALMAAQADPIEGIAAVSSYLASELYNVPVKASSIQDLSSNMTRFVVVRKQHPGGLPESEPTGDDKTMLVLNISDRVGALHEILNIIQQHSINLARIESRPSKSKAWEYIFFVDLHGHCQQDNIKLVLQELKQYCSYIRVLGSFPFVRHANDVKKTPK